MACMRDLTPLNQPLLDACVKAYQSCDRRQIREDKVQDKAMALFSQVPPLTRPHVASCRAAMSFIVSRYCRLHGRPACLDISCHASMPFGRSRHFRAGAPAPPAAVLTQAALPYAGHYLLCALRASDHRPLCSLLRGSKRHNAVYHGRRGLRSPCAQPPLQASALAQPPLHHSCSSQHRVGSCSSCGRAAHGTHASARRRRPLKPRSRPPPAASHAPLSSSPRRWPTSR